MCWRFDANDMRAARAARKAATAKLRGLTDCENTLGAAELVIGELISNAARHADGNVCLEIGHEDGHAQVSVHDTASTFAIDMSRPPDEFRESGRGLFIISELARKVSVLPLSGMGKRVSVMLDLPVADAASLLPSCLRSWLHHEIGVCLSPRVAKYVPGLIHEPELGAS